jgi:Meiotically up-regulated gene 113
MTLPKHVYAVKDRHGKTRWRFIKKGQPSRYLDGRPGTDAFLASYERCKDPNYVPDRQRIVRFRHVKLADFVGKSWVYFIGGTSGPVKIGTTVNLPARLKKLQTGSANRLRVLACVPGGLALEAEYHRRFAALQVNGEWFKGAPVRSEIARLRKTMNFQPTARNCFPTLEAIEK